MKTPLIGFATGNIYRLAKQDRSNLLDFARKLNIQALELTFADRKDLEETNLRKQHIHWLRKLDYVSIHAPFRLIQDSETSKQVIEQLDMIATLYHLTKACNVIIHPSDLPEKEILASYDMNFSTENMPRKKRYCMYNTARLCSVFSRYPDIGLCLDVSHAYLWSEVETAQLVDHFKDRITQVHVSGTYRNKDHQGLGMVTERFWKSIEPLRLLNAPFIYESDLNQKNPGFFQEEIECLKRFLRKK
ncbi:MAG: TIM barrel protein [Candidatus Woesearchaeota archaeon]